MTHTESRANPPLEALALPVILPDPLTPQERAQADAEHLAWLRGQRHADRLAYSHYSLPHEHVVQRCPECAFHVRNFIWALTARWYRHPFTVEDLFRR